MTRTFVFPPLRPMAEGYFVRQGGPDNVFEKSL